MGNLLTHTALEIIQDHWGKQLADTQQQQTTFKTHKITIPDYDHTLVTDICTSTPAVHLEIHLHTKLSALDERGSICEWHTQVGVLCDHVTMLKPWLTSSRLQSDSEVLLSALTTERQVTHNWPLSLQSYFLSIYWTQRTCLLWSTDFIMDHWLLPWQTGWVSASVTSAANQWSLAE